MSDDRASIPENDLVDAIERWMGADPDRDDGSMGVVVANQWTAKWLAMDEHDRDRVFHGAARQPLLAWHQVASIVQGLPPNPSAEAEAYWLDEAAIAGGRLRADIAAGRFAMPCTPKELTEWASRIGVELPRSFVDAVPSQCAGSAAASPSVDTPPPRQPSRHGSASTNQRDTKICARAREVVEASVSQGNSFKKAGVAEIIAEEFGLTEERARRVLAKAGIDWATEKARSAEVKRAKCAASAGRGRAT